MSEGGNLADVIFDMDDDLNRLVGLAKAVRIMGSAVGSGLDSGAVFAVGAALEDVALQVKAQWQRAFDMSRPGGAP